MRHLNPQQGAGLPAILQTGNAAAGGFGRTEAAANAGLLEASNPVRKRELNNGEKESAPDPPAP